MSWSEVVSMCLRNVDGALRSPIGVGRMSHVGLDLGKREVLGNELEFLEDFSA